MSDGLNIKVTNKVDVKKIKSNMSNKGDNAIKQLKNQIVKDTQPYVPLKTGALRRTATQSAAGKGNQIKYEKPYARYLYMGKVMIGRAPKTVSSKNLTYTQGGSEWFDKSKKANLKTWIKVAGKAFK